jgi:hypothetical protein
VNWDTFEVFTLLCDIKREMKTRRFENGLVHRFLDVSCFSIKKNKPVTQIANEITFVPAVLFFAIIRKTVSYFDTLGTLALYFGAR